VTACLSTGTCIAFKYSGGAYDLVAANSGDVTPTALSGTDLYELVYAKSSIIASKCTHIPFYNTDPATIAACAAITAIDTCNNHTATNPIHSYGKPTSSAIAQLSATSAACTRASIGSCAVPFTLANCNDACAKTSTCALFSWDDTANSNAGSLSRTGECYLFAIDATTATDTDDGFVTYHLKKSPCYYTTPVTIWTGAPVATGHGLTTTNPAAASIEVCHYECQLTTWCTDFTFAGTTCHLFAAGTTKGTTDSTTNAYSRAGYQRVDTTMLRCTHKVGFN
jgi:hypothetical protein